MRTLHLDKLKEGLPGITPGYGAFLAEAAAFCLVTSGHEPGVRLSVKGDFEEDFLIDWTEAVGAAHQSSWGDLREAAEYAAMGLSILMMRNLGDYQKFVRKRQGEVGDLALWKGEEDQAGTEKNLEIARLEVSGIFKASPGNSINMRIFSKRKQVAKPSQSNLLTFIAVVEFGIPEAKIVVK